MLVFVTNEIPNLSEFEALISENQLLNEYLSKGLVNKTPEALFAVAYSGKLLMTKDEIRNYWKDFIAQYKDKSNNPEFYFDIDLTWDDFKTEVDKFPLVAESVLKFIHRYDDKEFRWYLTVQHATASNPDANNVYDLSSEEKFFDIYIYGHSRNTDETMLVGDVEQKHCKSYFANIKDSLGLVRIGYNVNSTAFAWKEIELLLAGNQTAEYPDLSKFSICFRSIMPKYTLGTGASLVTLPHCIVIYLSYDGTPLLDNSFVVGNLYFSKGADYNSICPPNCSKFILPPGITF